VNPFLVILSGVEGKEGWPKAGEVFVCSFSLLVPSNEPKPVCRQAGKGNPTRGIFPPLTENRFQNPASNNFSCLSELLSSMLHFGDYVIFDSIIEYLVNETNYCMSHRKVNAK
jgi:hypothetical protein